MQQGTAVALSAAGRLQETMPMRKKEGLADYRYFPDPDLPPLRTPPAFVAAVRVTMAELPGALRARLLAAGVPVDVALIIAEDVQTARYYDAVVAAGGDAVQAGNWIQRDIMAWCKENNVCSHFTPLLTPFLLWGHRPHSCRFSHFGTSLSPRCVVPLH